MFRTSAILALALLSVPALARNVSGVNVEDTATVGGHSLVLNGAGTRSMFIAKVYVASLYVPEKTNTIEGVLAKAPRRVQMNMVRTLSAQTLIDALNKGIEANNAPAELAAVKDQRAQLNDIMNRIGETKKGDVITIDFVGGSTAVGLNGKAIGTIEGDEFNRALMKVWLGAKPVQGDLKKHMLGG